MRKKTVYKLKPGIILLSADDEHMLVATLAARNNNVPHVKQINGVAAFYWELLERDIEEKEKINSIAERFNINKLQAVIQYSQFKDKLVELGYMEKEEILADEKN